MKRTLLNRVALLAMAAVVVALGSIARSQSAAPPTFRFDPTWPKELPNNWLVGNVVGVAVDSKDNVWITHRPASQAGAEKTPPVLAFDQAGNIVRSWGGSGGTGYEWGTQAHGLYVDYKDNVWVGFGGGLPYDIKSKATTDNAHILKFTPEGKFLLQLGQVRAGHRRQQQHHDARPAHGHRRRPQDRRGVHHRRLHQSPRHRVRCQHWRVQASLGGIRPASG